jgi:hypothetical protein
MTTVRMMVLNEVSRLKIGEHLRITGRMFREAYPRMAFVEERPPEDQFLESRISANYGAWKCWYDLIEDCYVISRHEPGDKIVRRDYDRRHIPLPD